jgi:N-acetyl-beta-hexosaminidase
MDVTQPSLYNFVDRFVGEMGKRFEDQVYHIGGDEVGPKCW